MATRSGHDFEGLLIARTHLCHCLYLHCIISIAKANRSTEEQGSETGTALFLCALDPIFWCIHTCSVREQINTILPWYHCIPKVPYDREIRSGGCYSRCRLRFLSRRHYYLCYRGGTFGEDVDLQYVVRIN